MKIAWVHSFDKKANKNAGVFMFQLLEDISKKGFIVDEFYTGKINLFSIIPVFFKLRRKLKNYDLIHAQYGSGCGLVVSFLKGPKILTLRGSDWYISKKSNNIREYIHTRLSVYMTYFSIYRYEKVITMSKKMGNEFKNKFPQLESKVYTIMDGIDLMKFTPKNRFEERLKFFKTEDKSPWVLFSSVDDHNPLKRHYLAKKAFNIAKEKEPDLKLKFMNNIAHNDVPSFISCSNVIILTSTHEGWPNIIKEGLALNVPFVSSNVSDLKTIAVVEESCTVVDEEKDEFLFASKLADGILNAIKNENQDLRKHTKEMQIDCAIDHIINIYKNYKV